jgi:hypothetical protein
MRNNINLQQTAFCLLLIIWAVLTVTLSSCKKYDEQSGVCMSTVNHRLEGSWKSVSVVVTSQSTAIPQPILYSDYTESFQRINTNNWSYTSNHTDGTIDCDFSKKDGIFVLHVDYGNGAAPGRDVGIYVIHKLTNTELRYTAKGTSGLVIECKCVKQ